MLLSILLLEASPDVADTPLVTVRNLVAVTAFCLLDTPVVPAVAADIPAHTAEKNLAAVAYKEKQNTIVAHRLLSLSTILKRPYRCSCPSLFLTGRIHRQISPKGVYART